MSTGQASDVKSRSLSVAVVRSIAAATDRDPTALLEDDDFVPLYETIDPESLDTLFQPDADGGPSRGRVEFVHCGYEVAVESTGRVTVTER